MQVVMDEKKCHVNEHCDIKIRSGYAICPIILHCLHFISSKKLLMTK